MVNSVGSTGYSSQQGPVRSQVFDTRVSDAALAALKKPERRELPKPLLQSFMLGVAAIVQAAGRPVIWKMLLPALFSKMENMMPNFTNTLRKFVG